ncbi:MAG: class I SAM-dependent methyltransferase [Bacteroidales bacterium]|jgi:2-polyprenyl-3-methyl-5-hydroxy-6-metoxy-1,4-benzoquinol methylase
MIDNKLNFKYGGEKFEVSSKNLPPILKWIKSNSRVLELGSASGYMTKYLKNELKCNVTCVELNTEMAKLSEVYSENMIVENLDNDYWINSIDGTFDYILIADVLEHLRNPQNLLKNAIKFLKKDGEILISIPNIAHSSVIFTLYDGDFTYQELGLLDNTHIHFFTWKTFNKMMLDLNLELLDECSKYKSPGCTELKKFIITHPLISFLVIFRKDVFVYQFVTKWKISNTPNNNKFKIKRHLSFYCFIKMIIDDCSYFFYYHLYKKYKETK